MKIRLATIYGFGKWVDYSIDFSNQSFVTIYGENEAGKTTLQRFLLFMLFGLPPKQRNFYQPKTSSKMGGRLTIQDSEIGEFTIERLNEVRNGAAKCFTPDGKEFDEAWLQERLHGINEKTYRSIFSFSALDLSEIQLMKEEDIGEVLLGIGLTGSTHIYSIEKRLEQRLGNYFKPYGKNPEINQQLAKVDRLFGELTILKNEEATYLEKKNAIQNLESEIKLLNDQIQELNEKEKQLQKIGQALPAIEEYVSYQNHLADIPSPIHFPEDGISRLEALKETLLPIKSELSVLRKNEEKYLQEKQELEEMNKSFPYEEALKTYQLYPKYQENLKVLQKLREQKKKLDNDINDQLLELNIGFDPNDLENLNIPFQIEEQWNDLKRTTEHVTREQDANADNLQLAWNKQRYLDEQLKDIKSSLLPAEKRNKLEDVINTHKEDILLERLRHDAIQKQEKWKKTKQKTKTSTAIFLGVSVLVGVIFAIVTITSNNTFYLNLMLISIVIGIVQWVLGNKSIKDLEAMLGQSASENPVTKVSQEELLHAETLIEIDQENRNEMALLTEQLRETDIQLSQLNEQKVLLEKREMDLLQSINKQKDRYSFLQNLDVSYWPELYRTLKLVMRSENEKKALQMKEERFDKELAIFRATVDSFYEQYDNDRVPKSIISKLELLDTEINRFENRKSQVHQTTELLAETMGKIEELTLKHTTIEHELNLLYEIANVENEEEYYKKSKELIEQEKLINACKKITAQFSTYFLSEEWEQLVLNKPKLSNLEVQIEDVVATIKQLEADVEDKRQQLANIIAEFQRLESSETYSQTLHVLQFEQEKLRKLAKEWAVYKTAKEMLSETKDKYRDKYLAKVMEKTVNYFKELTEGTYTNVFAPSMDKLFTVERVDKTRYTVNELSQGTINQLYVSLRLAISEVMSDKMHLPFIIDDAFVHFDSVRTKRVLYILSRISEKHQILLFTCKGEVASAISKHKLIKLTNAVPLMEN